VKETRTKIAHNTKV